MNYLLRIFLSCWLAITTTAAIAAGSVENRRALSGKPSATIQDFSSIHFTVRAPSEESHQPVLIEGFWPLMQQKKQLLFLQGAWQRQQRNLFSIGLGWRYFTETQWGVGTNLFYDQDTTRQQRRLGLGAEAWWQSLTLAVNGYLPANGWRLARDLKAYQQRPAKGYDVTLRGTLPFLPHMGASVRYAHYFGDEVALGGVQQRYRNPKQWRWGIDFTPIPLLTLTYHRQAGFSSHTKQQISATLTYRFSLPLSQQLDPNQVTLLHSAKGQRLARVQREQSMPLQYARLSNNKPFRQSGAAQQATDSQMEIARLKASLQEKIARLKLKLQAELQAELQAIKRQLEDANTTQALKTIQSKIARLEAELLAKNKQREYENTIQEKKRQKEIDNQLQVTETAQREIARLQAELLEKNKKREYKNTLQETKRQKEIDNQLQVTEAAQREIARLQAELLEKNKQREYENTIQETKRQKEIANQLQVTEAAQREIARLQAELLEKNKQREYENTIQETKNQKEIANRNKQLKEKKIQLERNKRQLELLEILKNTKREKIRIEAEQQEKNRQIEEKNRQLEEEKKQLKEKKIQLERNKRQLKLLENLKQRQMERIRLEEEQQEMERQIEEDEQEMEREIEEKKRQLKEKHRKFNENIDEHIEIEINSMRNELPPKKQPGNPFLEAARQERRRTTKEDEWVALMERLPERTNISDEEEQKGIEKLKNLQQDTENAFNDTKILFKEIKNKNLQLDIELEADELREIRDENIRQKKIAENRQREIDKLEAMKYLQMTKNQKREIDRKIADLQARNRQGENATTIQKAKRQKEITDREARIPLTNKIRLERLI